MRVGLCSLYIQLTVIIRRPLPFEKLRRRCLNGKVRRRVIDRLLIRGNLSKLIWPPQFGEMSPERLSPKTAKNPIQSQCVINIINSVIHTPTKATLFVKYYNQYMENGMGTKWTLEYCCCCCFNITYWKRGSLSGIATSERETTNWGVISLN